MLNELKSIAEFLIQDQALLIIAALALTEILYLWKAFRHPNRLAWLASVMALCMPLGMVQLTRSRRGNHKSRLVYYACASSGSLLYLEPFYFGVLHPVVWFAATIWLGGLCTLVFGVLNLPAKPSAVIDSSDSPLRRQLEEKGIDEANIFIGADGKCGFGIDVQSRKVLIVRQGHSFPEPVAVGEFDRIVCLENGGPFDPQAPVDSSAEPSIPFLVFERADPMFAPASVKFLATPLSPKSPAYLEARKKIAFWFNLLQRMRQGRLLEPQVPPPSPTLPPPQLCGGGREMPPP